MVTNKVHRYSDTHQCILYEKSTQGICIGMYCAYVIGSVSVVNTKVSELSYRNVQLATCIEKLTHFLLLGI